jgi:hypothetical protein
MRLPPLESKPKTNEGLGAHGALSATPRVTIGTQPAESQTAAAWPARGIAAVNNPQATADATMTVRISPAYPAGVNSMFSSVSPRRINVGS